MYLIYFKSSVFLNKNSQTDTNHVRIDFLFFLMVIE